MLQVFESLSRWIFWLGGLDYIFVELVKIGNEVGGRVENRTISVY